MTKKALLSLRLSPKSSFTFSKLRYWSLRKPKNSSFYSILGNQGNPFFSFWSHCRWQENRWQRPDYSSLYNGHDSIVILQSQWMEQTFGLILLACLHFFLIFALYYVKLH